MDLSPNLSLPFIMAAQAQKHVTFNEAVRALDALLQIAVINRTATAPPANPSEGQRHIVAAGATGAWAGHDHAVAAYQDGTWAFYTPKDGWTAWDSAQRRLVVWSGAAWTPLVSPGAGTGDDGSDANAFEPAGAAAQAASQAVTAHVAADHPHAQYLRSANPVSHVGVNATADDTNRLAVNSDASLLNHNGAGHQVKVNKATAGATAAVLFQSNWSGRAEFGLAGDDDFHVKVSADGSSWHEAMVIGAGTGQLQLGAPLRLKQYARAQLPSPSAAGSGALAYVWDAPGGAAVVYCDGGRWRRVADSQELG